MSTEIRAWLDKFGHMTPDEIRDLLAEEHAYGNAQDARSCPLATFLRKQAPGYDVRVGISVTFWWHENDDTRIPHTYINPKAVGHFVHRVDRGDYPELARSWRP